MASRFLLRGIELANVQCQDVSFNKERREVSLKLLVSKTDVQAKGCVRTHRCTCLLVHSDDCRSTQSPALRFTPLQTCSCTRGRHCLCPFHALLSWVIVLRQEGLWEPENYLFGQNGSPPSKRQVVWLARQSAFALMQHTFDEVGPGVLDKCAQHSFPVAGSQMFARAGVPLPEIQVIGRWGSMSIMRYVQEAIFDPGRTADRVAASVSSASQASGAAPASTENETTVENIVRRLIAESMPSSSALVHNTRTKFVHKPCSFESHRPSEEWVTKCGKWHDGTSSCLRHFEVLKVFKRCAKCFDEVRPPAQEGSVESGSDSSSS